MAIRNLRLFVLFLAFSFGVITSGLGINAIVKSNQEKASLKSAAPPPTIVHIDTNGQFGVVQSSIEPFFIPLPQTYSVQEYLRRWQLVSPPLTSPSLSCNPCSSQNSSPLPVLVAFSRSCSPSWPPGLLRP